MLLIEHVVNDVAASIWATMQMHESLHSAEVVLLVEANLDQVQSNGICYGVQSMLNNLNHVSVPGFTSIPLLSHALRRGQGCASTRTT